MASLRQQDRHLLADLRQAIDREVKVRAVRKRRNDLSRLNAEQAVLASLQRKDARVNPSARSPRKAPSRNVTYERVYKGQTYRLEHHGGNRYYLNGTFYKSLTAAATAITGSHLSGKAFWGIVE